MASPPAWSMGTSQRSGLKATPNPGPGSYNPMFKNKPSAPGWRLGTASKSVDRRSDTPGPGSYNSPGKISTTSPRYGFGLKSPHSLKSDTPGPGSYESLGRRGFEKTPPAYSMRVRTVSADGRTRVPGPGTYEQTSRILNQTSPSYRIGSAKRDGLYQTGAAPGPGTYATRPNSAYNKDSGPKYGFGSASRDDLHAMSKTLPGPGTYEIKGTFESPQGKGMSLVPRRPDSALVSASRSPGPGAYNPNLSVKQSAPAYRIGSASRSSVSRESLQVPGPGNYDPRLVKSQQNIKIGTSLRSPLSASKHTPGPGTYEYAPKVGEGPKYVISPRREDVATLQNTRYVPGPGSYNPSIELVKEKSPGIRVGTGSREDLYKTKTNPGPGQYDIRGGPGGPRWGFGSDPRGRDYKSGVPGPGAYDIPSKIADVPKYAYGSAPLKIHL